MYYAAITVLILIRGLIFGGLYTGGLIFGGAYIWNEVSFRSVSTCGGLIHGGGLIVGGLRYFNYKTVCTSVGSTNVKMLC